jgi:hypothetical protein
MKTFGKVVAIVFVLIFLASLANHRDGSSSASSPPQAPLDLNSSKSLDENYGTKAAVACSVYADDYLRKVSKYTFKWDEVGFLDQKFDQHLVRTDKPGVLIMSSNKVALQNGFGAYQRAELHCDYDTQADKVVSYAIMGVS